MISTDLKKIELTEFIAEDFPGQRCRAAFPLLGSHGTKDSACVYFELDPGEELGRHTDSAEEVLLILEGTVEVQVGDESGSASAEQMVVVPVMEPHNIRNTGNGKARIIGFFGGANQIVAKFDRNWWPVQTNVVDTSTLPAV